ncbi:hypothetical protein [Candidatus Parabeggiatoa sp. HSG14]|uniref:hypothetical protein n=1 Tax=Candidatus Parabeggiatoa sp. HSG14 TaxID=3055593 RepID=UPI0025A8A7C0|nr:hypothetical protein [Thiotrichales bacterium HSG14]
MTKFIYPTLDLFLYDLREGLGQTQAEIEENRHRFKQKLPKINDEIFKQEDEQHFEPEYVELLGTQRYSDFKSEVYEGYYYPVRLTDSYGLLLDCSLKTQQQDDDLTWLSDLQSYINEQLNGQMGSIGQTLMFSVQLPEVLRWEHEAIAKRCYNALIPKGNFAENKTGQTEFLGGSLFEFWQYSAQTDNKSNKNNKNHHIIIIFYSDEKAAKTMAQFYPDWIHLLLYRHKMMWAYKQSRFLKKRLKAKSVDIEECRKEIDLYSIQQFNADKLQQTLDQAWRILSNYTTALNQLEQQSRTIETNYSNYQKRLFQLEEKTGQKLDLFRQFSEKVQEKYLHQIQMDCRNLNPELRSLENVIDYIRARVAIEDERRDRSFQETIAIWGIGLAAGAIVASISSHFPTITETEALAHPIGLFLSAFSIPSGWIAPGISLTLSVGAAMVAGLVTKTIILLGHR